MVERTILLYVCQRYQVKHLKSCTTIEINLKNVKNCAMKLNGVRKQFIGILQHKFLISSIVN